jgi:catechol 2,3-dioxygenase-like lactoylglutathione lyase family enzyme
MPFIATITIVVPDYDEAIAYYAAVCDFVVQADRILDAHKRWVVIGPVDGRGAQLLLAKASTPEQVTHIGNQTGRAGGVFPQQ